MKINQIVTNNLGLYDGKRTFDLSVANTEEPIVLFGGLNGAGKTTLFDGVRLCLYGKEIFKQISEANYHKYLKDKIHRSDEALFPSTTASIGIEFEFAEEGQINLYYVERLWSVENEKVAEVLNISKNNSKLEDVHEEGWQDFIKELIPIGVSQLFFFDGEKIQNIISDNNNLEFQNSVKSLLGIDIIERLQADIKIYQNRNLKNLLSDKDKKKLDELGARIDSIDEQINLFKDDQADIETDIQKAQNKLDKCKSQISVNGGAFFSQKDEFKLQKSNTERELEQIKERLRELATGNLPLAIADKLVGRLKEQVELEDKQYVDRIAKEKLNEKKKAIFNLLRTKKSIFYSFTKEDKESIKNELGNIFEKDKESSGINEIFKYSSSQVNTIVSSIENSFHAVEKLKDLTSEYERVFRKLQKILRNISRVPDNQLVKTMYDRLAEHSETLGKLITQQSHVGEKIALLEKEKASYELEQAKISQRISDVKKGSRKLRLTQKTGRVLETYKRKLIESRIDHLKSEFLKSFNDLHRKEDLVSSIEICPGSLSITMFDKKGKEVFVDKLSSGEKEIYAISLLTALAKTSGMNLPFIIDTPLGRLDTEHRNNLVKKFFPYVSHQMVILSTDTEIGKEYYKILEPHICQAYKLGYDNKGKKTQVEKGYFYK